MTLYPCVSKRHAHNDLASAQNCCISAERTGDKDELLEQEKTQEQTVNTHQQAITAYAEKIASHKKLLAELEGNFAQAKAKRQEVLASGQVPKPDNALASLPSDIEDVKGQIETMQHEFSSLQGQYGSAAERLSSIRRELSRIELHVKRDSLYEEMIGLIERWNECAAELGQVRHEAGDTGSDYVQGEYAILPPDMVRFGGSGRPALKAIGLRADVDQFRTGARCGMFL